MASYILKTVVGNEFNQVANDLGFGKSASNNDSGGGMSAAEMIAEDKKQKAEEEERRARHAKIEKERDEARQKIRDKYNIQKKGEPARATAAGRKGPPETVRSSSPPATENHGSDAVKPSTGVFSSLKAKFGWK